MSNHCKPISLDWNSRLEISIELYRAGMPIKQICARTQIGKGSIYQTVHDRGIPVQKPHVSKATTERWRQKKAQEAVAAQLAAAPPEAEYDPFHDGADDNREVEPPISTHDLDAKLDKILGELVALVKGELISTIHKALRQ